MRYIIAILGFVLVTMLLWDAFEVIILPRRVSRRLRFARLFYRFTWRLRSAVAQQIPDGKRRETYLSAFGPLSFLLLLGVWATGIIAGFAMLQWGLQDRLNVGQSVASFLTYLYMSGTTFFTLGLGDVLAWGRVGRTLVVVEAGLGFAFLGGVISYLPMIYQTFSRREVSISLLDARAGSPPSAGELLRRNGEDMSELRRLLVDWERWSAEVLESHLSYPFLVYFRSQHANQSWLAALTTILDACALVMAGIDGGPKRQAQLTFAKARQAVVELSQIFVLSPPTLAPDRLPSSSLSVLGKMLAETGVKLRDDVATEERLRELRRMYEPNAQALSDYLLVLLPQWFRISETPDSWQISNWQTPILSIATENSAIQETNGKRFAEG
ncbi:MAG TPA: potassium channel family protein [Pyrinomonadaceae bacterium]|nr:potassium channel family protein [Pyrinomonadaceae bacterium]